MEKWNELRDMLIQGLVQAEAGEKNETERVLRITLEKMSELERVGKLTKYQVGNQLKLKTGSDTVKSKIIYVAPIDGYGVQHYLCEVYSLYANGGERMFLSLAKESEIDEHFVSRM